MRKKKSLNRTDTLWAHDAAYVAVGGIAHRMICCIFHIDVVGHFCVSSCGDLVLFVKHNFCHTLRICMVSYRIDHTANFLQQRYRQIVVVCNELLNIIYED